MQRHKDSDGKLSDDTFRVLQSPENLSETALRKGSSYSPKTEHRDVRPKIKTSKEKQPIFAQDFETNAHKGSRYSPKLTNLSKSYQPIASNNSEEYDYEVIPNDSDYFNIFNMVDNDDRVSGSHHHLSKPITEISNNTTIKKHSGWNASDRLTTRLLKAKIRAQNMNRDSETLTMPNSLGLPSHSAPSSSRAAATVTSNSKSTTVQRHLNPDDIKVSSKYSKSLQTQRANKVPHNQSIGFTGLTQQKTEISQKGVSRYKVNSSKAEYIAHERTSLFSGGLHKSISQPHIPSSPHIKKQKSASDLESVRLSFEHKFEPDNVKAKVKSMWNSIRYGWTLKSKSSFKHDSPLFILGKCYHKRKDDSSTEPEEQFLQDFGSRIWLTYRSNFYPIPGTKLNTDCGWGCMLRSGQMLIAQCLVTHFLGRDWRLYNHQSEKDAAFYREIIRWFSDPLDFPSDKTPFCLHHLAHFGRAYNKDPGEWYGPASVAYIFRDAFIKASHSIPVLNQLCVYVAQDCTVYVGDVIDLCTKRHKSESMSSSSECDVEVSGSSQKARAQVENEKWQRSLIILIPMRLGGDVTNEIYTPCVQNLLSHSNCMGIIGGRPKHSLYFLGYQESKLIYLDPHLCREAVDTTVSDFKIETFHCMTPRKLAIRKMDPSCTVGFYIHDAEDFKKFIHEVNEFIPPSKQKGLYPLFVLSDGYQSEATANSVHTSADLRVKVTHYLVDEYGRKTLSGESEEFVML